MTEQISEHDRHLWKQLMESYNDFSVVLGKFLLEDVDRISLMRRALRGSDQAIALFIASYMKPTELVELFDQLVFLASFVHGSLQTVRKLILALPREWVLANIESVAEPLLQDGTYDEYRRFLELYIQLDRNLALKLARRAAENPDEDIHEAGEDFLEKLKPAA